MVFRFRFVALSVAVLAVTVSPLRAQQTNNAPAEPKVTAPVSTPVSAPASAPVPFGPTVTAAAVGAHEIAPQPAPRLEPPRRTDTNHNRAMMIVGGAALIVGAIIGDTAGTLIMVGGAAVGLYGLYKFLQ